MFKWLFLLIVWVDSKVDIDGLFMARGSDAGARFLERANILLHPDYDG
jgi:hypothetical protein